MKNQRELLESPAKVYNFQVGDYHTYYVASGVLGHNSCYNPKSNATRAARLSNGSNATRAARLSNGSTAYLQENGEYAGKLVAKDFAKGVRILAKHSSNAGKVYEIVRWLEIE